MTKKILKIGGVLGLIAAVAVTVFVVRRWDQLRLFTQNAEIDGPVETVPQAVPPELPPLTDGAADWICWRGAGGDGRSAVTGILTDWSAGLAEVWEINFLCRGKSSAVWSAPVIKGNRLIVTGRNETEDLVFCLNPDSGGLIWQQSYTAPAASASGMGSRATPYIDDARVYTFGRAGDLVCWRLFDGTKVWQRSVNSDGGKAPKWGHSSSPLVFKDLVIVAGGGSARTIAYDKMTGAVKWKSGSGSAGYAAITQMPLDGEPAILSFHGKGLAALKPADGAVLWNTEWITSYDVNATTPVYKDDIVFITSGYKTGGRALRVSATRAEVLWTNKAIASHHSDPYIIDGCIYGYSGDSIQNRGAFKCVDLQTGEEKWSTNDMGWGTCQYVDGYLLCMDIKGNLFLMQPAPTEFKLVTKLPGALGRVRHATWTIPVVANGKLYLRYKQQLRCYQLTPPKPATAPATKDSTE